MKTLYTNVFSALLYDDSITVPCTIKYSATKFEVCENCIYDNIGQKSANKFRPGGPIPFSFGGICPMCNGTGKRSSESSENLNLMIIWDYKEFIGVGTVNNPEGMIQTITFIANTPKLKRADELLAATNIGDYVRHRFQRISEPEPCGLEGDKFISVLWKRIG